MPLIIFLILLVYQWNQTPQNPAELPATPMPKLNLTTLFDSGKHLTQQDFLGHVSLLNIWASWCTACHHEHQTLMNIKNKYHIPIYGIDAKDNLTHARRWLQNQGNPYNLIGNDPDGEIISSLGIYGLPVTYVIDPKGMIRYQYEGAINESTWENIIWPIVQRYSK